MFISKEKYKACIYTRLSKDDGDKPESDSIGNQKALIRDFIKAHPEIEVVSEKADDGCSLNRFRASKDAMSGQVKT